METINREVVYNWLKNVSDPEIPVLTIEDMGILRDVRVGADNHITVYITPTYSGCPAMDMIAMSIRMVLLGHQVKDFSIEQILEPAWTTDWISEGGLVKMKESGIAPPKRKKDKKQNGLFEEEEVDCTHCGSSHTELVSQFGATSCKSLYRCLDCKEPFEHFKCH